MSYKQQTDDLLSDEEKETYIEILQRKLIESEKLLNRGEENSVSEIAKYQLERVHTLRKFREDSIFTLFAEQSISHFSTMWDYYRKLYPTFKQEVKLLTDQRTNNVIKELKDEQISIEERITLHPYSFDNEAKNGKIYFLREQSNEIKKKINEINSNLDSMNTDKQIEEGSKNIFAGLYTEEKKKQVQEFVRKKREERMERRKRLEEQRKKEEEELEKKQAQIEQNEEKIIKARREEILRKQKEWHDEREKEKSLRQQRNSQYLRIKKEIKEKPPLFRKWGQQYEQKHEFTQMERRQKVLSQRKSVLKPIDQLGLEDHEKGYDQLRQKRQKEREEKLVVFLEEQAKSRVKYHSSYELPKDEDEKEREKELAKEKLQKIKEYKQIVRDRYKPKIDEDKRKQLSMMIEEMEINKRRVKKTVLENGNVVYEDLNSADHRMMGMKYLELTKEMAAKAMGKKRKASQSQKPIGQHKKTADYLEEMRKNPRPRPSKLAFIKSSNISYEQKINKVYSQAQKLQELAKQNEMKLKFGKFKTSEEILTCKEEIDQNYLDIANMKLKLIKQK